MVDPPLPADERVPRAVETGVPGVVSVPWREWRPAPLPANPEVGWTTSTDGEDCW